MMMMFCASIMVVIFDETRLFGLLHEESRAFAKVVVVVFGHDDDAREEGATPYHSALSRHPFPLERERGDMNGNPKCRSFSLLDSL